MSFQLCLQFSSLASRSHQARVWSAAAWRGSEATSAPSASSSASHRGWRGHSPLPRLALRYYGARRRRGDTCMSSHAPAHTSAQALKHPSEGIKPWKCGRCWCFSSAGMASPLSFFSTSCCLSRCWKGLGRRESMAQKTPHVSASQWQITVPSPKRRRLKEQNHSVFSLLWKGTWLFGGGGERGADGGSGGGVIDARCSDLCRALRREIRPICPPMQIHLGGGRRRRHTPSTDSHQHRVKVFLHREKSLAELNPPALFSPC